mmetsp:Transcript_96603/g.277409  ORF Transcript_96603/g.277409 Transcript_96603/m.277409 type:complete len:632 (+) Transcript_96603:72-1967(+)
MMFCCRSASDALDIGVADKQEEDDVVLRGENIAPLGKKALAPAVRRCPNCFSTYHEAAECPLPKGFVTSSRDPLRTPVWRGVGAGIDPSGDEASSPFFMDWGGNESGISSSCPADEEWSPEGERARADAKKKVKRRPKEYAGFECPIVRSAESEPTVAEVTPLMECMAALGVRVQVLKQGDWVDLEDEEFRQMRNHIAAGEIKFGIAARGGLYVIDVSDGRGPLQSNPKSGKSRRMRILMESGEPFKGDGYGDDADSSPLSEEAGRRGSVDYDQAEQAKLGPQSKRGEAPQLQLEVLSGNAHAKECFSQLHSNEEKLCGEWAVFYHAYSYAALIYEVNAAVGAVLFRFRSQYSVLPRVLINEFEQTPDALSLIERFKSEFSANKKDHNPEYRKVAISTMCSSVALGPEASTPVVFLAGYSERDLSFLGVLENLLESCFVPRSTIKRLAADIVALSEKHGLDVSQFGGKGCESGRAGHMLQIFIRRDLVDQLAYAAVPYGAVDKKRHPISKWLNSDSNMNFGQARIVAHPKFFMQASCVRMHVVSADPCFHASRPEFQEELTSLLGVILSKDSLREKAARGIFGGELPAWWTNEDQRQHCSSVPGAKAPRRQSQVGAGNGSPCGGVSPTYLD